jgi:hypothetical protein
MKGFKKPTYKRKARLITLVYGLTKTGKTRFALTAPAPIAFINFDRSLEDVLPDFKGLDIGIADYSDDLGVLDQAAATKVMARFQTDYAAALADPRVKTVVVDKLTTLWEVMRWARLGKVTQVRPHHYTQVNQEMRQYMLMPQATDKNVIFIEDVKEEWLNEKSTGRMVRDGFKHGSTLVQLELEFTRNEDEIDMEEDELGFHAIIKGSSVSAAMVGFDFEGDQIDFKFIAEALLPEVKW